jgi:dihydrofolate reductase
LREVNLFIAASLDGYIAGPNDNLNWLFTDQDYGYNQFYDSIDTIIMGRRSFEIIDSFGPWPYGKKQTHVFSSRTNLPDREGIKFETSDPCSFVTDLKSSSGATIWLLGGGLFSTELLKCKLVDKIVVSVHPILLGDGITLFHGNFPITELKLLDSTQFESGLVQLSYEVATP